MHIYSTGIGVPAILITLIHTMHIYSNGIGVPAILRGGLKLRPRTPGRTFRWKIEGASEYTCTRSDILPHVKYLLG